MYVAYIGENDKAIHVVSVHGGDNWEVTLPAIKGELHGPGSSSPSSCTQRR